MLRVILCLSVLAAVGGADGPENDDIKETLAKAFVINRNGAPKCAGVAVGERHLIATAAHCVYGVPKSKLTVWRESAKNLSEEVIRVMVHPYYKPPSPDYDIALLKIESKANEKGLSLRKVPPSAADNVTAITWQETKKESKADVEDAAVEDRKSCRAKMSPHVAVSSRMLCANVMSDSLPDGRVLLLDGKVLGLGSHHVKADDHLPKIFTNVANSEIYSFIERYAD